MVMCAHSSGHVCLDSLGIHQGQALAGEKVNCEHGKLRKNRGSVKSNFPQWTTGRGGCSYAKNGRKMWSRDGNTYFYMLQDWLPLPRFSCQVRNLGVILSLALSRSHPGNQPVLGVLCPYCFPCSLLLFLPSLVQATAVSSLGFHKRLPAFPWEGWHA